MFAIRYTDHVAHSVSAMLTDFLLFFTARTRIEISDPSPSLNPEMQLSTDNKQIQVLIVNGYMFCSIIKRLRIPEDF